MAKEVLLTIKKDIIKGIKINQSILQFNFIPDTVSKIIKTGEDSGGLENSFSLVQQIFYSKYQAIMQNLIHVLPIIIIMMTSIMMICFIFLLFMPLYSVGI
jgi:type II secretory pathway component PulF